MDNQWLVPVASALALLVAVPLTYWRTKKTTSLRQEISAQLQNEYLRGKADGAKEEFEKFQINYQPVVVDVDGYFSHKFDAGYEMQLFYSGLPVGDPTRRITHHEEKAKDDNINKVIDAITGMLEQTSMLSGKQIATSISKVLKKDKK